MTESQALEITQAAVKAVMEKVGDDRQALVQEMSRRAETDARLQEAMVVASFLMLKAHQETRH